MELIICFDCKKYQYKPKTYNLWFYKEGHIEHNTGTVYRIADCPVVTKRPINRDQEVWLQEILNA